MDLKDLAIIAYPQLLSAGVETGLLDQKGRPIATNHLIKFKGHLCRLTIDEGCVMIKHPRGNTPLYKWHDECLVLR